MHVSVLSEEVIEYLNCKPGMVVYDCTLGMGGHTRRLYDAVQPGGHVVAIEVDSETLALTKKELSDVSDGVTFVNASFSDLDTVVQEVGRVPQGILFDLGISSYQLDNPARGFTFQHDGPLDMRMERSTGRTAADVVNIYDEAEMTRILRDYADERFAGRIAKAIVSHRKDKKIETTAELVDIVKAAVPRSKWPQRKHVATKTFMALRIEVNNEFDRVEQGIQKAIDVAEPGARIAIITFHSIEDRLVKRLINDAARACTCPKEVPLCVCETEPQIIKITRKAVKPSEEEIKNNPRSRSAQLRVIEKK